VKNIVEEGGKVTMCYALEQSCAEGIIIGEAKGRAEEKNVFAEKMLRANEPLLKIMQYTQLSLEQIQEIAKSIGVTVVM